MPRIRRLLIIVITLLLFSTPALPQETVIQAQIDLLVSMKPLLVKEQRFREYVRDFMEYGQSNPVDIDRATGLMHVAGGAANILGAANLGLGVYVHMSIESDRAAARPLLESHLVIYPKRLDALISVVNIYVSNTQSASIANSASRLKDDLRETKALLESLKLP